MKFTLKDYQAGQVTYLSGYADQATAKSNMENAVITVNGDIVAALLDDEATVKRFFMEPDGMVRLQPENEAFEPIYSDHAEILGIVTAVMRRYR